MLTRTIGSSITSGQGPSGGLSPSEKCGGGGGGVGGGGGSEKLR